MSQETNGSVAKSSWMPKAIGAVVVLVVGAVVAMTQAKDVDDSVQPTVATTPDSESSAAVAVVAADAMLKDGIYSTTGNYVSPAGPETIDVTLTIKDGLIADAAVKANATNPVSTKLQGMFVAGYKELVIGKKLADLSLSKVSGASLTTQGFNEALSELKTQASV